MRDAFRLVLDLVARLPVITGATSVTVTRQAWFRPERNWLLRSELAIRGPRRAAALHQGHPAQLETLAAELAHDARAPGATGEVDPRLRARRGSRSLPARLQAARASAGIP